MPPKREESNVLSEHRESKYFLYILRASNDRLYIGQTNDLSHRLQVHASGHGAKYTRSESFSLVHVGTYATRTDATQREQQLKRWTRAKKEALIAGDMALLKSL